MDHVRSWCKCVLHEAYFGVCVQISRCCNFPHCHSFLSESDEELFYLFVCLPCLGVLASVGACPLDVAKTRIQGQKLGEPKLGMVEVFRTIIRNEGPRYLFKGLLPRLIAVPSMMSFFYMLNVYFSNWFASK